MNILMRNGRRVLVEDCSYEWLPTLGELPPSVTYEVAWYDQYLDEAPVAACRYEGYFPERVEL